MRFAVAPLTGLLDERRAVSTRLFPFSSPIFSRPLCGTKASRRLCCALLNAPRSGGSKASSNIACCCERCCRTCNLQLCVPDLDVVQMPRDKDSAPFLGCSTRAVCAKSNDDHAMSDGRAMRIGRWNQRRKAAVMLERGGGRRTEDGRQRTEGRGHTGHDVALSIGGLRSKGQGPRAKVQGPRCKVWLQLLLASGPPGLTRRGLVRVGALRGPRGRPFPSTARPLVWKAVQRITAFTGPGGRARIPTGLTGRWCWPLSAGFNHTSLAGWLPSFPPSLLHQLWRPGLALGSEIETLLPPTPVAEAPVSLVEKRFMTGPKIVTK
jgi:hypothetical protein